MAFLKSIMSALAVLVLAAHISVDAAPTPIQKRILFPNAPLASDIGGAHLLLLNDVDSANIIKNAYVLLSKPRGYYDGMSSCLSMGDGGYIYIPGTSGATELVSLLNKNSPAQAEVSGFSQYWVYNGVPGVFGNCLAVNKNSGKTDWIPCSTQLPTVCFNSVMRRVLLFDDDSRQIKVNTPVGQIQGWRDQNAFRFLGIPFAEAPIGNRRFAAPVPKAPFTSTLDARDYRDICPQTPLSPNIFPMIMSYLKNSAKESEDCLNLNVYTPSLKGPGHAGLPVMVYFHGGEYQANSGSIIIFEPGNLVSRGGVVVVTVNYRLGVLGWMENAPAWGRNDVSGNQAFRDMILSLEWTKKNIASFGGDPNRMTVFGESAGANSIRALLAAPSTWGLYQSVIGESDPLNIPFKPAAEAKTMTDYLMTGLGCGVTDLACARSKSVDEILKGQAIARDKALADDKWTTYGMIHRPTIDGVLIPDEFSAMVKAGTYNTKANIMWGTTKDEAGLYVPVFFEKEVPLANLSNALSLFFDDARVASVLANPIIQPDPSDPDAVRNFFTKIGTDHYFYCPVRYLSRKMSKRKPTYNFRFNRGRDIPLVGVGYCSTSTGRVCHSYDIQSVFASGAAIPGFSQTGDDARFARQVVDRFTTFAKTGNPNPQPGQVGFETTNPDVTSLNWVPYSDSNPLMELNVVSSMSYNADNEICSWIDNVFLYDFWYQMPGNTP